MTCFQPGWMELSLLIQEDILYDLLLVYAAHACNWMLSSLVRVFWWSLEEQLNSYFFFLKFSCYLPSFGVLFHSSWSLLVVSYHQISTWPGQFAPYWVFSSSSECNGEVRFMFFCILLLYLIAVFNISNISQITFTNI